MMALTMRGCLHMLLAFAFATAAARFAAGELAPPEAPTRGTHVHLQLQHSLQLPGRKLLQPSSIGVAEKGKRKGVSQALENAVLEDLALNLLLQTGDGGKPLVAGEATGAWAGTVQGGGRGGPTAAATADFAANGLFGGASKQLIDFRAASDKSSAQASGATSAHSVGQPGVGLTSVRSSGIAAALSQHRLSGPQEESDASSEEGYSRRLLGDARAWGSKNDAANDTEHQRKLHAGDASTSSTAATAAMAHAVDEFPGLSLPTTSLGDTYEVLLGAAADYSVAGDYYYIGQPDYNGEKYDYDYGQPRFIPEAGLATTRVAADSNDRLGRAAAFGSTKGEASAPAAASRSSSIASSLMGQVVPYERSDAFGEQNKLRPPANPVRRGGANAAGVAIGRSYKLTLPSSSSSQSSGGSTSSRQYATGAAADALNTATGTRSALARSQVTSATSSENVFFDAAGRKL